MKRKRCKGKSRNEEVLMVRRERWGSEERSVDGLMVGVGMEREEKEGEKKEEGRRRS